MTKSTVTSGESPASLAIQCRFCEKTTVANVQGEYVVNSDKFDPCQYLLAACQECSSPTLLEREANWEKESWGPLSQLWPQDPIKTLNRNIPLPIRRELIEADACFNDRHYTAAAVMVRRTLEGVCADQGKSGVQLFKALKALQDDGKLEGRLVEWAQELRVLGNQGAHFSKDPVKREDAKDGLALAEAIVDYLYVFTATYDEFKKRRSSSASEAD